REEAVARVVEDRDPGEVDRAVAARMVAPILHVDAYAARVGVDHVPFVGGVELAELRHDRLDPPAHGFAAVQGAEDVLDVDAVLREALGPGVPVPADRAAEPVPDEGRLDLLAGESWHRQRARSKYPGGKPGHACAGPDAAVGFFRAGFAARAG